MECGRGMGARPKLTQKRRTQMLEAAMEVIAERGLCETRIADVAERAGLSPALVVYYFGSKETLLTEALAYAEDLFYIEAFRELTGIEGASHRLVRLIELACPPVAQHHSRGSNGGPALRRVRALRPRALCDVPLRAHGRPRATGVVRRPRGERRTGQRDLSGCGGQGVGLRRARTEGRGSRAGGGSGRGVGKGMSRTDVPRGG